MPSFDIVSEVAHAALKNAVDNASRQLATRWDFKNVEATFDYQPDQNAVVLTATSEFHLRQMSDILRPQLLRAGIEWHALRFDAPVTQNGKKFTVTLTVKQGLDDCLARKIIKLIKERGLNLQTQIQDGKVRVSGKHRDDLQQVIHHLREMPLEQPLQFNNFKS